MSLPPSKHLAVIAAAVFVLAVSLLVLTSSGYDGEDGAEVEVQPVESWNEAQAVIIDISSSPDTITYYASIQDAVNAALEKAEAQSVNAVTVYVKQQEIQDTINVGYFHVSNGNSLLEITIRGIESEPATNINRTEQPEGVEVTLSRNEELTGPMFHVEGRLVLDNIIIKGASGTTDDNGCAIQVAGEDPSVRDGELELVSTTIDDYNGVAIEITGGLLNVDEGSSIVSSVSDKGVITSTTSLLYLSGSIVNTGSGYELYVLYDELDNGTPSYGLTIYPETLDTRSDTIFGLYLGYSGASALPPLNYAYLSVINRQEDSAVVDVSNRIDIVLEDGFQLGTPIVDSAIGSDVFCENENLGWIDENGHGYCFLITPVSDDFRETSVQYPDDGFNETSVIILKQGDDAVFSGIINENGMLRLDPSLQGVYSLFLDNEQYSSINLVPETTSIYVGENLPPIDSEIEIYVRFCSSVVESAKITVREVHSDDNSIQMISNYLTSTQMMAMFFDITVNNIDEVIFSLELPDGIDSGQAIVFREHKNADSTVEVVELQLGNPYTSTNDCFMIESIGGKDYVTIRSSQFSVFAIGEEEPAPSPPPERTVVNAAIEDRQVRITVGPESYKEYAVRDVEGDLLQGWESGASGLTISFDLLPPGSEYRVMSRYAGTTSEILEATIVAPKDPVIEVVSVWVDGLTLSTEEMVEYRLLLEDGTPVGSWIPGDGEDGSWTDLDPTLDYYAEATSTSDGMTLSTGPVLVKEGVSTEVTGVVKHGGMYLVVSSLDQGWSCSADAEVYSSSGTSVVFGPLTPGTVTLSFTDGEEVRDMDVIVPEMPQDSEDDADTIVMEAQDGVMYRLYDHTGAVVSDGWVDGGGTLTWNVDPLRGYFVTMITGNGDGTVMFPMTEVKRPAEMISPTEGA